MAKEKMNEPPGADCVRSSLDFFSGDQKLGFGATGFNFITYSGRAQAMVTVYMVY